MKDRKWQIYLAGKMGGLSYEEMNDWRIQVKTLIQDKMDTTHYQFIVVNPCDFYNFESVEYQSQAEVMDFDLLKVKTSDLIIVNANDINTSIGTVIEVYESWKRNIPVLAFGDFTDIHPWIKRCFTRKESSVEDVVDYIKNFYCA